MEDDIGSVPPGAGDFATTHWSLVLAADPDAASRTRARQALEELCRAYWYPVYAFVRYRGHAADDAQDLTQSFFTRILETAGLAAADPARGRFRSYLLGAVKHFLANEWQRARAEKRGGGVTFLELDALEPEARYALEPLRADDPEAGFDREWAQATVARAMEQLRAELEARGKGEQLEALKGCLDGEELDRDAAATRLGLSAGAVKTAVYRLRQRYRELLRAEIAATVDDAADVDAELRHLAAALRGK